MNRSIRTIHIFGASGSGVTTLGKALASISNIPYFDSDDYFWQDSNPPYTIRRPAKERNERIRQDLAKQDRWILGGSIIHWSEKEEQLFPTFHLIIFCYLPPDLRLARLAARERQRYGSIIETDPQRSRQYQEFMTWAKDYDIGSGIANRTLRAHEAWLNQQSPASVIIELRGDLSVEQRLQRITSHLS